MSKSLNICFLRSPYVCWTLYLKYLIKFYYVSDTWDYMYLWHVKNVSLFDSSHVLIYCCEHGASCLPIWSDVMDSLGFARNGNASDGYERQLRTENEYTNTRLFSFFSRVSPVHGPVKYNLWLNERTLLVKQIQLRADINDPICTPRGEYFAIIRSCRNAWTKWSRRERISRVKLRV